MQRASSPVVPATMGPPTSRFSSVRNDRLPSTRGQTPSERSSTSSRSKRNTCFVCTTSSAYDSMKLINCFACKRKFHRGCHKPPVAQKSPPDWTCYMCAPPKTMPPAGKKRKLSRAIFAPPANDRSRLSSDGKEIPESPQEQPDITKDNASRPNALAQPPRFAPFTTEAGKRSSIDSVKSGRRIKPPRFVPSATNTKDHAIVRLTDSSLESVLRVGEHSPQSSDPSLVVSQQALQISTPQTATSTNPARNLSSHELIGMALHEAPDCCLSREEIQRWIVDNVPSHNSKDASWQRGVWVTLSVCGDFVYSSDKAKTTLWTFSDGSSDKFRKWQKPVNNSSSSQDALKGQERTKQGKDVLGRNAKFLAPDHELDDLESPDTQSDQSASKENTRARSNINSALPSTIDETLEMIDLTMDDEPWLPPSDSQEPERSATGHNSSSFLQTRENISVTRPNGRRLLKRSNSAAFGKPVWSTAISVNLEPHSSTPLVDGVLEKASQKIKETSRRSEKWNAAVEKTRMGVCVKSPMKAKIDLVRKSRTKSPMNLQKPTSPASQPLASSSTQDAQFVPDSPQSYYGLQLHNPTTGVQTDVLLHSDLSSPDIPQRSTTANDLPAGPNGERVDWVIQMDVDVPKDLHEPKLIEPEPTVPSPEPSVPAQSRSDEITQSGERQEPLHQESFSHEPLAEKQPAQELLIEESPRKTYADLAVQTSLPTTSAFTLGTITQISLEPRVLTAATSATVRATANSTTQIKSLPEPQTAPLNLPRAPTVQLPTPQAEPIEQQPLQENRSDPGAAFKKDCLSLLDEMMYPTIPTTPDWPSHFSSLPDPFLTPSVPLSTIQARPTRKQIFGRTGQSRIEHNDALTRLNKIKLGAQNVGRVELGKGYTEEERKREIKLNEKDGYYDTLEELLNMPQQVVPFIHEQQLTFRDYAPNALGKIGRPRVIYKIGPNAK